MECRAFPLTGEGKKTLSLFGGQFHGRIPAAQNFVKLSVHGRLWSHSAPPGLGGARLGHLTVPTGEARFRGPTAFSDFPVVPRQLRGSLSLRPEKKGDCSESEVGGCCRVLDRGGGPDLGIPPPAGQPSSRPVGDPVAGWTYRYRHGRSPKPGGCGLRPRQGARPSGAGGPTHDDLKSCAKGPGWPDRVEQGVQRMTTLKAVPAGGPTHDDLKSCAGGPSGRFVPDCRFERACRGQRPIDARPPNRVEQAKGPSGRCDYDCRLRVLGMGQRPIDVKPLRGPRRTGLEQGKGLFV